MKFLAIRAANFMSYKELDFIFPQSGLFFVGGSIAGGGMSNSNGAGKSAIFEALCYGLFGKTIRKAAVDDVINWNNKKDCFVEVILEDDGGEVFIIQRYRGYSDKSNSLLLFKGDDDISEATSRKTQEKIDAILGMNWLVFSTAVVFGEQAQRFTEARDSEKKEIFDEILMLHQYQDAQKLVKENLKSMKERYSDVENKIEMTKKNAELAANELEIANKQLEEVGVEKKEIQKKILEMETKKTSFLDEKKNIESEFEESKKSAEELKDADKEFYAQIKELEKKKEMLDFSKEVSDAQVSARMKAEKMEEIARWLSESESLQPGTRCPKCRSELTPELISNCREEMKAELEKAKIEYQKLHDIFEKKANELKSKRQAVEKEINDAMNLKAEIDEQLKSRLEAVYKNSSKLKEISNKIAMADEYIDNWKTAYENKERHALENKERLEKKISELSQEIDSLWTDKALIEEEIRYLEFWVEGFSNKGIKSLLLDEILPQLNNRVAYYASTLLDEHIKIEFDTESELKSGETRDKFNVKISIGDNPIDYRLCSSGEKGRIDAAILLALQSLIFERSASSSNLVVLDEVFEHLDIVGIERTVNLLAEEAKDKAIFVISHQNELQDYFENSIIVYKGKDGFSRIREG